MLRKALALGLLLMTGVSSAIGQDGLIPIQYQALAPSDPRAALLWADQANVVAVAGEGVMVLSMELPTSNDGTFLIQMMYGGGMCGINECTVRIAEDGVPIADFSVCDDFSQHALSADGTKFYACGVETDIAKAVPPAGLSLP